MSYTNKERQVLTLMERANFKNLSKYDIVSFASKLGELRPEVANEILAQFPEFIGLLTSTFKEYKGILDGIVKSNENSLNEYYNVANKELDNAHDSRIQFYDLLKQVQSDYSKCLENENLSENSRLEILSRQEELIKIAEKKDSEIREQEIKIEENVNKKDSENKEYNWKLVGAASMVLVAVVGITSGLLGGKFDLKLPNIT